MAETTVLKVLLHCDGCVAKVKRHLKRLQGVDAFHVDQKNSKVTVFGSVKPEVVLETVLKAGKTAEFWPQPPPPAPAPAPEAPVKEPTAREPTAKEPAVKEPANEPSKETAPKKKVVTNWATAGRSRQIKKIVVETEDDAQSMVDAVEMDEFGEDRENDPVFVDAVNHDMQQQEPLENPKKGSGALKSLGGNNYNKLISESSAALGSGKKHHNHQNGIQKHQIAGGSIGASQGGGGKKNKSSAQILSSNKALGSIGKMGGSPTRF